MIPAQDLSFKYDVAISFLWPDVGVARSLKALLEPGLTVYVASERKEETLGRDGLEVFGAVFGREARLAVILYREGWGDTKFTAVEEVGIKDRALATHMKSFVIVPLDRSPLRLWMPEWHLYALSSDSTEKEIAAVIRARAAEVGAEVKSETAGQAAMRMAREARGRNERLVRYQAADAPKEVMAELPRIYEMIGQAVREVAAEQPELGLAFDAWDTRCLVSSPRKSMSVQFRLRYANSITNATLCLTHWDGEASRQIGGAIGGVAGAIGHHRQASIEMFSPGVSDENEWVWRSRPDLEESPILILTGDLGKTAREFADYVVNRFFGRLFEEG